MEYLLAIGLAMFAGLFLSRLTSRYNLPDDRLKLMEKMVKQRAGELLDG